MSKNERIIQLTKNENNSSLRKVPKTDWSKSHYRDSSMMLSHSVCIAAFTNEDGKVNSDWLLTRAALVEHEANKRFEDIIKNV